MRRDCCLPKKSNPNATNWFAKRLFGGELDPVI